MILLPALATFGSAVGAPLPAWQHTQTSAPGKCLSIGLAVCESRFDCFAYCPSGLDCGVLWEGRTSFINSVNRGSSRSAVQFGSLSKQGRFSFPRAIALPN